MLSSLSVDFSKVFNNVDDYLSALHKDKVIDTIYDLYYIVDAIEVEAGINPEGIDYSIDFGTLVSTELKQNIIRAKQLEIFNGKTVEEADPSNPLKAFYLNDNPEIGEVVSALNDLLNCLKIQTYTLADKLQSIEDSIDALENYLVSKISDVKLSALDALSMLSNANAEY